MDTNQNNNSPFTLGRAAIVIGILALCLVAGALGAVVVNSGDPDDDETPITVGAAPATATEPLPVEKEGPAEDLQPAVDADDVPIDPDELDAIHKAALEMVGGGTVVEVDRSDDIGEAFEVEVLTDQGEVDVGRESEACAEPALRQLNEGSRR
jgi:hypothetical protein